MMNSLDVHAHNLLLALDARVQQFRDGPEPRVVADAHDGALARLEPLDERTARVRVGQVARLHFRVDAVS